MAIRENLIQARSLYVGVSPNVAPASSNLGVDGSIGIGTPTPNERLHIVGNTGTRIRISSSDNYHIGNLGWEDTRVFLSAAGYGSPALGFDTAGSERMRITNGGNVGIGTTNPGYKLDVNGSLNVGANVYNYIGGNKAFAGNGSSQLYFYTGTTALTIRNNADSATLMTLTDGGNVGIGTTSPGSRLEIAGALGATVGIGGSTLRLVNTDTGNAASITAGITGMTNDGMQFSTDGTVRMIIASGGNVGIGTSSPGYKLDVNGAGRFIFRNNSNEITDLLLSTESANSKSKLSFLWYGNETAAVKFLRGGNSTGSSMEFWTQQEFGSTTQRMTITSSGNVGIATTAPTSKLHITDYTPILRMDSEKAIEATYDGEPLVSLNFYKHYSLAQGASIRMQQDGGIYSYPQAALAFYTNDGSIDWATPIERMRIKANGNVGIGTSSPVSRLTIKSPGEVGSYGDGFVLQRNANTAKIIRMYESSADGFLEVRSGADDIISKISGYSGTPTFFLSNVGIGTTSPLSRLHTLLSEGSYIRAENASSNVGSGNFWGFGLYEGSTLSAAFRIVRDGTGDQVSIGTMTNQSFAFWQNGSEKMRIAVGGNVGIGTTNPQSKLQIGDSYNYTSGSVKLITLNTGGYYSTTPANQYNVMGFTGTVIDASDIYSQTSGEVAKNFYIGIVSDAAYFNNNRFSIVQGGVERLTVQGYANSGNVGIGTTNPGHLLSVNGNASIVNNSSLFLLDTAGNSGFQIRNTNSNVALLWQSNSGALRYRAGFASNSNNAHIFAVGLDTEIVRFTNDGNVGIGTSAPAAKLEVYGSGSSSSTVNFLARNSSNVKIIESFDNGFIRLNNLLNTNQAIYINNGNSNYHYALDSHIFNVVDNSFQRIDFVAIKGNAAKPAMGVGTINPDRSAILDVTSRDRGFLPPRMTNTEMNAISTPAAGLVVYDNTNNKLCVYNGSSWVPLH